MCRNFHLFDLISRFREFLMNNGFDIVIAVLVLRGVETELFIVACAREIIRPLCTLAPNLTNGGKDGFFWGRTSSSVCSTYLRDSESRHFRISRRILGIIICVKISSANFASLANKSSCACDSDILAAIAGTIGSCELCPAVVV